mmetsp:Transcript_16084/g.60869  ORF Transcript_16084/g.60869 Transcript_16084/m.60869 type:complete len:238 (-) Transcript_16084:26-739(-)
MGPSKTLGMHSRTCGSAAFSRSHANTRTASSASLGRPSPAPISSCSLLGATRRGPRPWSTLGTSGKKTVASTSAVVQMALKGSPAPQSTVPAGTACPAVTTAPACIPSTLSRKALAMVTTQDRCVASHADGTGPAAVDSDRSTFWNQSSLVSTQSAESASNSLARSSAGSAAPDSAHRSSALAAAAARRALATPQPDPIATACVAAGSAPSRGTPAQARMWAAASGATSPVGMAALG